MSTIGILVIFLLLFGIAYLNHRFAPDPTVKIVVYIVLAVIMLFFIANLAGMTDIGRGTT